MGLEDGSRVSGSETQINGAKGRSSGPMSQMGQNQTSARASETSAFPSGTDIVSHAGHVRFVPILLQKSFLTGDENFSEPLMRFVRRDVRDTSVHTKTTTNLRILATERCSGRGV
jgi:hypothetical protein